jgi:hypothetical protein
MVERLSFKVWRAGGADWSEPEGRGLQVQRCGAGPLRLLLLAGRRQQDLPAGVHQCCLAGSVADPDPHVFGPPGSGSFYYHAKW